MLAALRLCRAARRLRRRRRAVRNRPAETPAPTVATGGGGRRGQKVDRFDEDRAWKMLEYQVKLGPRPAGSRAVAQARAPTSRRGSRTRALRERCPAACATSSARSPARASRSCSPPTTTPRTCRASWAPTTARAAPRRCSSSRACCRRPSAPKNAPPIRFVAFDGEEATDDADFYGTGLRGSKPYAKQARQAASSELVLLDFVADKDLAIPREQSSDARDVGGPARGRRARRRERRVPGHASRASSRTTTRRSSGAACRRST